MPTKTFMHLSNEKKEKILSAAKKEFTRVPLSEVSINNIIKDAQIARGSFYQYFENKQDLFNYILKSMRENINKELKNKLDEKGDIFDTFIYFYDKIIKLSKSTQNRKFYKTIFLNIKANDSIVFNSNIKNNEIKEYMLTHTNTSQFQNSNDLINIIEMLNAITRWAIVKRINSDNDENLKNEYLRQIEYLKYGVLRREKKC